MTAGNLGTQITSSDQVAQREFDAKTILAEDGDVVALIGTLIQLGLVHIIKDGSGFLKDDILYPEYDSSMIRQAWRSIFWDHLHDDDGDKKGGSLFNIKAANLGNVWTRGGHISVDEWFKTGQGAITRTTGSGFDKLKFETTAVSTQTINGMLAGIKFSFENLIDLQMRFDVSHNTDIFLRLGINTDRIEDTQDTARRQFGLEACPASGTNLVVISANGNAANLLQVSTTVAINAAINDHQLTYHPGVDVKYYYAGVLQATTNSANTPSNGETDRSRQLVAGVKTNTGAIRSLFLEWYHLLAKPSSEMVPALAV